MRVLLKLLVILAASFGAPAGAARIEVGGVVNGVTLVFLDGAIEPGDADAFSSAIGSLNRAVLVLNSPGGALAAGLAIGTAVRDRGFATLVGKEGLCASACALIWLAGRARHAADGALIGFHAPYVQAGSRRLVSSVASGLVGGYLARLGFSDSAIAFAVQARPTGMSWLQPEAARALGIIVLPPSDALARAVEVRAADAAAAVPPAEGSEPAPPPLHRHSLSAAGRRVPLPPGEWLELLGGPLPATVRGLREMEITLARRDASGVDAFVLVSTADRPDGAVVTDWGRSPVCSRHERLFLLVHEAMPVRQDCAQLDHVVLFGEEPPTPGWGAALAFLASQAEPPPQTFLAVTYRFAAGASATTVTYLFAVERFGFPASRSGWRDSPWHPDHLDETRRRLVERFRGWLETNQPVVRAGVLAGREGKLTRLPH